MALCLGTYGDPKGVGVSYERGTPETFAIVASPREMTQGFSVSFLPKGEVFAQIGRNRNLQGYLAHKKPTPPPDRHRALRICLL